MTTSKQRRTGHISLLLCNTVWGAAVPVSKFILLGGIISSTVLADVRILSGTILFWLVSLAIPSERAAKVDKRIIGNFFLRLFSRRFWCSFSI